jgi:hypothetical protein
MLKALPANDGGWLVHDGTGAHKISEAELSSSYTRVTMPNLEQRGFAQAAQVGSPCKTHKRDGSVELVLRLGKTHPWAAEHWK